MQGTEPKIYIHKYTVTSFLFKHKHADYTPRLMSVILSALDIVPWCNLAFACRVLYTYTVDCSALHSLNKKILYGQITDCRLSCLEGIVILFQGHTL